MPGNTLVDVRIGDEVVTTIEDHRHPFWNDSDGEWQRVDELDVGDLLVTADGEVLTVEGLDHGSTRQGLAYNLTVDGVHTYYVGVGDDQVLVHNVCDIPGAAKGRSGGRYDDLDIPKGGGFDRHHMPADQVSPLSKVRGPSILMETADHYQTASWGSRNTSKAYRAAQQRLIEAGRFDDAIQMDIDNIQSLFGDRYDEHILEMIDRL